MRLYWEFAVRGFRRYATYRTATWAGVFTNTIFGFMIAYTLLAVFKVKAHVGGYDASAAVTYVFVGQGLLMTMFVWGGTELGPAVRTGNIATDLYRPIDYQLTLLAQDMGRCAYHFLLRGIPPFLLAAPIVHLRLPHHWWTWLVFAGSVAVGNALSFAVRFIVSSSAFWVLDEGGFTRVALALQNLLTGSLVPVALFPPLLEVIAKALPFWCFFALPLDVFLERARWWALPLQVGWTVVLLGVGRRLLAAGTKKLVIQGG